MRRWVRAGMKVGGIWYRFYRQQRLGGASRRTAARRATEMLEILDAIVRLTGER